MENNTVPQLLSRGLGTSAALKVKTAIELRFLAYMCLGVVHSTKLRDFCATITCVCFL